MGYFMGDADIFIPDMLSQLNLRFAPAQASGDRALLGGIEEMTEIQKEFGIFKPGRSLEQSVRALNLMYSNNVVKQRWLTLIAALAKHPSNRTGENGNQAIVNAILENFGAASVLPVYFTSHDMEGQKVQESPVLITPKGRPVHYLEVDYLVLSLPIQSKEAAARVRSF